MQRILVYGVDVSDPENPKYRAMQVDQHGRLVIDPEDLDTRYLKLDGSNEQDLLPFSGGDFVIRDYASYFGVRNKANTAWKSFVVASLYANVFQPAFWDVGYIRTRSKSTAQILLEAHTGAAFQTIARLMSGANPYFDIPLAGDLLPISNKSLGSASQYWNQAFVDAILCSNSIDMHPTAGDAVIYFKHDGAANEASLRYDKVNKRLEQWIDGAIVGYCNAALGWVNGAP
jgi:hypothetical protein